MRNYVFEKWFLPFENKQSKINVIRMVFVDRIINKSVYFYLLKDEKFSHERYISY